ncbi:hypothetical protein C2845_PM12G30210 [Panicum miliaceum]|uniref:BHLH domain-containing protein n=1 Tax=Panicum miliaceum TaxID=4540 RepID=A0A3L6QJE1_PANMI|nr:hypothetical protein C2845_PM12G30210 [Panicum miliaceum]
MDAQQLDLFLRHQSMANICESEDALGSSESEPARPARPRGKRSRAAEVHNLSEKRRRSKINEKMKALQTLIPNSSKMLSMRNGLYLPPANISGVPEALAPSEVCATLNLSGVKASDSGVALLPVNQSSVAHHSFDPPNHDQRHNKSLVLQSVPTSSTTIARFLQEPAQANLQSFQLALPPEMIFKEDMMLKHHLTSVQETTSLPGHELKLSSQETCMVNSGRFDRGSQRKEVARDMMPKNTESVLFMPYLHSLQSGDASGGLRAESS